jgi:hypothetical protein
MVVEKDIYYTNSDKATLLIALTAYDIQAKNYAKNTSERKQKRDSSGVPVGITGCVRQGWCQKTSCID